MQQLFEAITLEARYQQYRQRHHRLFWALLYSSTPELYPPYRERTDWLSDRPETTSQAILRRARHALEVSARREGSLSIAFTIRALEVVQAELKGLVHEIGMSGAREVEHWTEIQTLLRGIDDRLKELTA